MLSPKEQTILAILQHPANEADRNRCISRWFYPDGSQTTPPFRVRIESVVRNYVSGCSEVVFRSICDDVTGHVVERLMNPNIVIETTLSGYIYTIASNLFKNEATRKRILGEERLDTVSIDSLIQLEDKEGKRADVPSRPSQVPLVSKPDRVQRMAKDSRWTDPLIQAGLPKLSEKDRQLLEERYLDHEDKHGCVKKMEEKYGQNLDTRFERIYVRIAEAIIPECEESLKRLWPKYKDCFPEEDVQLITLFFQKKSQEEICAALGKKRHWKCFARVAEIHANCVSRERKEYNEWKKEQRKLRQELRELERPDVPERPVQPKEKTDNSERVRKRCLSLLHDFGDGLPEADRRILRAFLEEAGVPSEDGPDAPDALYHAFSRLVRLASDAWNARIAAVRDDKNRIRQVLWKFSARKDWDISYIAPDELEQIGQRCLPLIEEFVSAARNKMTPALRLFFQHQPMREISKACGQPDMTSLATFMLTDFNAVCDKATHIFRARLTDFDQSLKDFSALLGSSYSGQQN